MMLFHWHRWQERERIIGEFSKRDSPIDTHQYEGTRLVCPCGCNAILVDKLDRIVLLEQ